MASSLFRQQALDAQNNKLHGDILLLPKLKYSVITSVLILWLLATASWLSQSQFAKKETVGGWLEPSIGVVKVYSEDSIGRVKQVLVNEGQRVSKDDPLVIVNGDRVLANGEALEDKLLAQYKKQQSFVQDQIAGLDSSYELRSLDLMQQAKASRADLLFLKQQVKTLEVRHQLLTDREERFQSLSSSGLLSRFEVNKVLEQRLGLENELQSLKRGLANQRSRIEQLDNQLVLLPNEKRDRRAELGRALSDLAQQIAQLNGQRAYIIRAPTDGVVSNLQTIKGTRLNQQKPILTLLPENSRLEVILLIPVRAAGLLEEGYEIEIRYDAFPYQKFGLYGGKLVHIGDHILLPVEQQDFPVNTREPMYLAKATLHQEYTIAYGQQVPLKAGMTLSSDIKLRERSLLEWLLEPVLSLKGRL